MKDLLEELCKPNERLRLQSNKYEVVCVTTDPNNQSIIFGDVDHLAEEEYLDQKVEFSLLATGKGKTTLECIELCPSGENVPSSYNLPFVLDPIPINTKLPLKVTIRLNPVILPLGFYAKWLVMKFQSIQLPYSFDAVHRTFLITRKVSVKIVNSKDMIALKLNVDAPAYIPQSLRNVFDLPIMGKMVLPKGIGFFGDMAFERSIPQYNRNLKGIIQNLKSAYASKFCHLLEVEEKQMQKDIKQFDLFFLKVEHHCHDHSGHCTELTFRAPGASENRPALNRGDIVLLHPSTAPQVEIETRVVDIRENEVRVVAPKYRQVYKKHHELGSTQLVNETYLYETDSFHIRFGYHRFGLRLVFDALYRLDFSMAGSTSFSHPHLKNPFTCLLNPTDAICASSFNADAAVDDFEWFHPQINAYQKEAVMNICNRNGNDDNVKPPYIIFGPPGTGKTLTVIECILQASKRNRYSRILATAPSEAAADILAMRLIQVLKKEKDGAEKILRLNWPHRKPASVPVSILSYCTQEDGQDIFKIPNRDALLKNKIIVSTCVLAGVLRLRGIKRGDFEYLFIDEAAQALEPESFVAIDVVGTKATIVLAGDPCQLGASLRSDTAAEQGLSISYQERLMSLKAYTKSSTMDGYRNRNMTKLLNNYRSHEALLKLPSNLFYGNELKACADPRVTSSLCKWDMLPKNEYTNENKVKNSISSFPLLFYGIFGQDYHEIDSPSYYNPIEASQIADLIDTLLSSRNMGVDSKHFGVITPFRQQVLTLRKVLRSRNLGNINVGTVENFQGQESKIILISTVLTHDASLRSNRINTNSKMYSLINDPKRFNVAITRAKALVIVVGHPIILRQDPYWRQLIEYCIEHNAIRGNNAEAILTAMSSSDSDMMKKNILQEIQSLGAAQMDIAYPKDLYKYYRSDDSEWRIVL